MRTILFLLLGLGLALLGRAQTLPAELNIGIDQIKGDDGMPLVSVNISTNRFEEPTQGEKVATPNDLTKGDERMPQVPVNVFSNRSVEVSRGETAAVTNEVTNSRLVFLMSTGEMYASEGEYEEAESAYLRALEMDVRPEIILFQLGTLYLRMERFADAVAIFKGIIERHPENALAHNNLAWCYATSPGIKNKKLALRHAREAILSESREPAMWNTLAEAYYMSGNYENALRSSEYAMELLAVTKPTEETKKSFLVQRAKILRAQEALNLMEGREDE